MVGGTSLDFLSLDAVMIPDDFCFTFILATVNHQPDRNVENKSKKHHWLVIGYLVIYVVYMESGWWFS